MRIPTAIAISALCVGSVLSLSGCQKAGEKAAETMVEKAIEAQAGKDGTHAKVDISGGTSKITTTDAEGKSTQAEFGGAKVSETELGVPFYPGTSPQAGRTTRVTTPEGTMVTVSLHSADAPDKVAGFYRDKLRAQSAGKSLMDMAGGDGGTALVLADEKGQASVHINISKADNGTDIQILANQATGK